MGLSILPVGGYGEVGRNCTAIIVDDELFLLDLGLHLERYVALTQDDDIAPTLSKAVLIKEGAAPDITAFEKDAVKAILISHAHLDHVGAVPYLANSFDCAVHGTPFTKAVADKLVEDKGQKLHHPIESHPFRARFRVSEHVEAEFVEVTHSTPQTAAIVLHTPYGKVVYLNDFKLDPAPSLGKVTDLEYLSTLHPVALIIDTLYADTPGSTPGEAEAEKLLEAALLSRPLAGKRILVTTFASHISRLHTIARLGARMGRKTLFVGRSIAKYLDAAKDVGVSELATQHEMVRYGSKVGKALSRVARPEEYLFVVTGGMAEPKAVLSRILEQEMLPLKRGDIVVFSNRAIPTPTIIPARKALEDALTARGIEVLKDLHVSGHGSAEDHRSVLNALKPRFVIPTHGEDASREAFRRIALQCGVPAEHILVLSDGEETLLVR
jgi:ribonuclease J